MPIRKVVLYPDPILETRTQKVTEITPEVEALLNDMYETMVASDGIGIAAPQIGSSLSIAIVELDEESGLIEMINPEIVSQKGKDIDVEGCLSFPDIYGTVERADEVVVRFVSREGIEYEVEAEGYLARALQHEIEHLEGKLFTDKIIKKMNLEEFEAYIMEGEDDED